VSSTPSPPPNPGSGSANNASNADTAERLRGRLMAQSLGQLLDQARGAREVLPHLAALERSLLERGAPAVDQVPLHWLGRICSQLSSLPMPQQDVPLHDLLNRLMKRLQGQRDEDDDNDVREGFDPNRTVVIREISHTEFDAAQAEQAVTERMPRL
jgi:hypothetical protein